MYTLTEIGKDNVQTHDYLGYGFSVVDKEKSPDEFLKAYMAYAGENVTGITIENIEEPIFSFVISEGGKEVFPLFFLRRYYIVTENGKTFKNLTFK